MEHASRGVPPLLMKPPRSSLNWELWREALALVISPNGEPLEALGKWLMPPTDEDHVLHSPEKDMVFVKHNLVWKAQRKKRKGEANVKV